MSAGGATRREARQLEAFHDGELWGLSRWRLARRLERSPELRRELRALERMGSALRAIDTREPAPDLWGGIAGRLEAQPAPGREPRRNPWSAPLLRPVGALAAAALAALVLVQIWPVPVEPGGQVVRWIDTGGRSVMVLEDSGESHATIIWMLDPPAEGASGVRRGASRVDV